MAIPALAPLAGKLAGLVTGAAASMGTGLKAATIADVLKGANDPKLAKARAAAQDFEQMFLEDALGHVFASTGPDGPLGDNGLGGDVYKSMLVKEYAKTIVKSGGVGISHQIYGELLKLQESQGRAGKT